MNQQVNITLKLSLWLDAEMDEDEIVTHVRASLPKAFGEELTVMDNPVDILEVKQEAEIYGEPPEPNLLELARFVQAYAANRKRAKYLASRIIAEATGRAV